MLPSGRKPRQTQADDKTMIRLATLKDSARLREITTAAYGAFAERIGKTPAPMLLNYDALIPAGHVWVLDAPPVVGLIVMHPDGDVWLVESLAVDTLHHGHGHGSALLKHAEIQARRAGASAVSLYTNAAMTENLSFYPAFGYVEVSRRIEDGFNRVYFQKRLPQAVG